MNHQPLAPGDHVRHEFHPLWKGVVVAVNPAPAPGEQEALIRWMEIDSDTDRFERFRRTAWHSPDAFTFADQTYPDSDRRCLVHPAVALRKLSIVDLIADLDPFPGPP